MIAVLNQMVHPSSHPALANPCLTDKSPALPAGRNHPPLKHLLILSQLAVVTHSYFSQNSLSLL